MPGKTIWDPFQCFFSLSGLVRVEASIQVEIARFHCLEKENYCYKSTVLMVYFTCANVILAIMTPAST